MEVELFHVRRSVVTKKLRKYEDTIKNDRLYHAYN